MRFLQPAETTSNVHISIDAEEVSGSNPLSPTRKKQRFVGQTQSIREGPGEHLGPLCSNRADRTQGGTHSWRRVLLKSVPLRSPRGPSSPPSRSLRHLRGLQTLCEVRCRKTWPREGRRSSMLSRDPSSGAATSRGSRCSRLKPSWITSQELCEDGLIGHCGKLVQVIVTTAPLLLRTIYRGATIAQSRRPPGPYRFRLPSRRYHHDPLEPASYPAW